MRNELKRAAYFGLIGLTVSTMYGLWLIETEAALVIHYITIPGANGSLPQTESLPFPWYRIPYDQILFTSVLALVGYFNLTSLSKILDLLNKYLTFRRLK